MATAKKHTAPKKETVATNPTAPEEVTVPPEEAVTPPVVEANPLMQVAGKQVKEDARPLAVIASNLEGKLSKQEGKTLYVAKSKDQAVEILANGVSYRPYPQEGVWVWAVDDENVEMFDLHTHVQHGKIVKSAGK